MKNQEQNNNGQSPDNGAPEKTPEPAKDGTTPKTDAPKGTQPGNIPVKTPQDTTRKKPNVPK